MKYLIIKLFVLIIFGNAVAFGKDDSVKLIPEKPKAGDVITVIYDSKDTPLQGAVKIEMTAYLNSIKSKLPYNIEGKYVLEMNSEKNLWTAKITCTNLTELVGLVFKSDKLIDNNDGKGYFIKMHDEIGVESPISLFAYALAINSSPFLYQVKQNPQLSYELMNKVFQTNPELKPHYLSEYLPLINRVLKDEGKALLVKELDEAEKSSLLSDKDYYTLVTLNTNLGRTEKSDELKKLAITKFPNGTVAAFAASDIFEAEKDLDKKIDLAFELDSKFKNFFKTSGYLSPVSEMFRILFAENRPDLLRKLWNRIADDPDILYYSPENMINEFISRKRELELALEIAIKSAHALQVDLEKPIPTIETKINSEEEIFKAKKDRIARFTVRYAHILFFANKPVEALKKYEEAFSVLDVDNYWKTELEIYSNCLFANKKYDEAKTIGEKLMKQGNGSESVITMLKDIFKVKNGNDTGFDEYIKQFDIAAETDLINKLKKEMINERAPQFSLTDLDGKKVSLSDLKGSVVIVDFWATWCGPCKASFPEMQQAVDKYANDKNVKFLFVNTWQKEENKKLNAENFIKQNKYSFHVLLDNENKVVASYKVDGIPTKFVVDRKGNIRFRSEGSTPGTIVREISTMIELAAE